MINEEQLSLIANYPNATKTIPHESFDYNIAKELKNYELYQYLDSFEFIRMNFFLEDLYILLYYKEIADFKNPAVMEKLKNELHQ